MSTVPKERRRREVEYPTTDGKPMGETELHIDRLIDTLQMVRDRFASRTDVYVGGNLMLYYEEGNRRKHVSPDVFVSIGVPKKPKREYYLVWKEGKGPDLVVEITSPSTRSEDMRKKFVLYRDVLRVLEYFLFDPRSEYLDPPLQGFRLTEGEYVPITPVAGRLPSQVLGLHLERDGENLRLFDPATGNYLLTPPEARDIAEQRVIEERQRADEERQRTIVERQRADEERQRTTEERQRADEAEAVQKRLAEEIDRLRREIESMRGT